MSTKDSSNNTLKKDKKKYEPPKAVFVSLKLEERLMACLKIDMKVCGEQNKS